MLTTILYHVTPHDFALSLQGDVGNHPHKIAIKRAVPRAFDVTIDADGLLHFYRTIGPAVWFTSRLTPGALIHHNAWPYDQNPGTFHLTIPSHAL